MPLAWYGSALRRCRTRSLSKSNGISCMPSRLILPLPRISSTRPSADSTSTVWGDSPSRPSRTALGVPCPWPVAPREPYSSARIEAVCASRPSFFRRRANIRAARIGPTVWELDGPMPTEKRSKTEMATGVLLGVGRRRCLPGWCENGPSGAGTSRVVRERAGVGLAGHRGHRGRSVERMTQVGAPPTLFSVRGAPSERAEPQARCYFRPGYSGNFSASATTRALRSSAS